jgi:hypothetical protein
VTVLIDGAVRFGPYSASPAPLDLTPWVNNGAAHEIRVKAASNGAADVLIQGVEHWTTLATQ